MTVNDFPTALHPELFIKFISEKYGDAAVFSTSLSLEDQVITHYIFSNNLPVKVFTIDTGRMFPETYSVLNATREKYQKKIDVFFPDTNSIQKLLSEKGPISFYESVDERKKCCFIRKVEPLERALFGAQCWITGIRKGQSDGRNSLPFVEYNEQYKLFKTNPLLNWTDDDVKAVILKHNIPYNVLFDKGYASIGCQPCTRPVKEGESARSGRWWWENNEKKECGLHS
jgi:phosphoadenosine phosphosulfate reductase